MASHVGFASIGEIADGTGMRPDPLVQHLVVPETILSCKRPAASRALKHSEPSTPPHTSLKARLILECPATVRAHVGFLIRMGPQVLLVVVLAKSNLAAKIALVLLGADLVYVLEVVVPGRADHYGSAEMADELADLVLVLLVGVPGLHPAVVTHQFVVLALLGDVDSCKSVIQSSLKFHYLPGLVLRFQVPTI